MCVIQIFREKQRRECQRNENKLKQQLNNINRDLSQSQNIEKEIASLKTKVNVK